MINRIKEIFFGVFKNKKTDKIKISFIVSWEFYQRLQGLKKKTNMSISEIFCNALQLFEYVTDRHLAGDLYFRQGIDGEVESLRFFNNQEPR